MRLREGGGGREGERERGRVLCASTTCVDGLYMYMWGVVQTDDSTTVSYRTRIDAYVYKLGFIYILGQMNKCTCCIYMYMYIILLHVSTCTQTKHC